MQQYTKIDENGIKYILSDVIVIPKDSPLGFVEGTYSKETKEYNEIAKKLGFTLEEKTYTYNDYDNAMEEYIRQVRVDRGYTLREPSDYDTDPYPRFAQDAKDFILFRSLCMQYALPILNRYKKTGEAPTMDEFREGFPKITWTYTDEEM